MVQYDETNQLEKNPSLYIPVSIGDLGAKSCSDCRFVGAEKNKHNKIHRVFPPKKKLRKGHVDFNIMQ